MTGYNGASNTVSYEAILRGIVSDESKYDDDGVQFAINLMAFFFQKEGETNTTFWDVLSESGSFLPGVMMQTLFSLTRIPDVMNKLIGWKAALDEAKSWAISAAADVIDDFSDFLYNNKAFVEKVEDLTGIEIIEPEDLDLVVEYLRSDEAVADTTSKRIAYLAELLNETNSKILDGILDAHSIETYIVGINRQYYGYAAYCNATNLNSVSIPREIHTIGPDCFRNSSVNDVVFLDTMKYIGDHAFESCYELTSINFPNSLLGIGDHALYECTGILSITVPDSVQTLGDGCMPNSLTSLTIPFVGESREVVDGKKSVFYHLFGLENRESYYLVPDGYSEACTKEGYVVFPSISHLTEVNITDTTRIPDLAFHHYMNNNSIAVVHLPEGLLSIGSDAFSQCILAGELAIPDTVTDIGDYAFFTCENITSVSLPESLLRLGLCSFCNCSGITELTLPEGLEFIGDYAFNNCVGVTTLTVPNSVQYIGDGALPVSLTSLTIPFVGVSRDIEDGYWSVFYSVFGTCDTGGYYHLSDGCQYATTAEGPASYFIAPNLKEVTITDTTRIPKYAFYNYFGANSITMIHLPDNLQLIGEYAFENCSDLTGEMVIPETVTEIESCAFYNCSGLTSINLPAGLTVLSDGVLSNCTGLTEIVFPDGLQNIEMAALSGCTGLTSITLPAGISVLNNSVLRDCTGLTELTLPDSLEQIGEYALNGCTGIKTLKVPDSVQTLGNGCLPCTLTSLSIPFVGASRDVNDGYSSVFNYVFGYIRNGRYNLQPEECVVYTAFGEAIYMKAPSLKELTITDTERIPDYAFYNLSGANALSVITLPDNLQTIGNYAFQYCNTLTGCMRIPDSVTTIGDCAFNKCDGLTSVRLPAGLTILEKSVFAWCDGLTELVLPEGIEEISTGALYYCSGLKSLFLPQSLRIVKESATYGCNELKFVVYAGTENQWQNVQIEDYNEPLTSELFFLLALHDPDMNMPTGLTVLEEESFMGIAARCILLPDSLKTIKSRAFADCPNLRQVYIPDTVTSMAPDAFAGCRYLVLVGDARVEAYAKENGLFYLGNLEE